jgi:hypothetical protein
MIEKINIMGVFPDNPEKYAESFIFLMQPMSEIRDPRNLFYYVEGDFTVTTVYSSVAAEILRMDKKIKQLQSHNEGLVKTVESVGVVELPEVVELDLSVADLVHLGETFTVDEILKLKLGGFL